MARPISHSAFAHPCRRCLADATRDKFIGDWMTTGDEAIIDEDGYYHFVGREDDVINSAGYRIGPDIYPSVRRNSARLVTIASPMNRMFSTERSAAAL